MTKDKMNRRGAEDAEITQEISELYFRLLVDLELV